MSNESFLGLIHNISMLLALVLIFDIVSQNLRTGKTHLQNILAGLIIGGVGIAIMLTPWVFIPGVIFDTRSVLLGISGLFFGTVPTLIAMAMTIILRLYQGGTGTIMGVFVILATGFIGILWRKIRRKPLENITWVELYIFGLLIHIVMVLLAFTMPIDIALNTIKNIYLPVLVIYPLGTVLMGLLIITRLRRELLADKISESEERFRIVAENTYDWEYWFNAEGRFEYCSPSCFEISGHTPEEFINNPDITWKMIHPDDMPVYKKHRETDAEAKKGIPIDFRIIRPDGSIRWISHACQPLYDTNGKFVGTRGSNRDITEKKQAEEALRINEDKYRSYTEKISDVIWVLDTENMNFMYTSPSVEKLRGYSVEEVMALPVDYAMKPEESEALKRLIRQRAAAFQNGTEPPDKVYINEVEQPCKDGSVVMTEVTTSFQYNPETGHVEALGVTRNIAERKKMEIALQKEINMIEAIFNSVPGVLYLYDSDGYLLRWNKKHEEMTGYSAKELDHFFLLDWYKDQPEDIERVTKGVEKAMKEGFAMAEANLTTKSGEKILFEFTAARLDVGDKVYFTGIGIDIRERRAAEIKIRETTADLERKKEEAIQHGRVLLSMLEDQKRAEEALEREQYLMRILMDTIPDTIWFKDRDGRFLRVNKAQAKKLGVSEPAELLGKTDFDFFSAEHAQLAFEQELSIINKSQLIINDDELLTFADRPPEWVSVTKLPLFDQNNNIVGTYGISRDISERKKAEEELKTAYDATLEGWAAALELREKETANHSRNVVEMTLRLAEKYDFSEEEISHIRRGALLHDIGKMGIPDSILLKPGPLTDDEWKIMRMHPIFAHRLLSNIPYLQQALLIPYAHHERWNGAGYPLGLKGADIPLPARLFAVVDVWDALSSDRPYRPAWTPETVINYLKEQSGIQFDPDVVDVFLQLIKVHEEK
jgi:PAS domain S-box-containing protein